ncbi:hypothetical protein [Roseobacter litoralis]|nr:hypothetical protein [Roseobacter litoralis]
MAHKPARHLPAMLEVKSAADILQFLAIMGQVNSPHVLGINGAR